MKLFDASRKKLANGLACYEGLEFALPSFSLRPLEGGRWHLMVFLPSGPARATPRWGEFESEALVRLLEEYLEAPEETLRRVFGWEYEEAAKGQVAQVTIAKTDASADELGF